MWPLAPERWTSAMYLRCAAKSAFTSPVSGGGLTGGAAVRIYTMSGQLVYSDDHVANDAGFWDGRNATEQAVASGLYLVRVSFGGRHAVRTLAVVR